MFLELIGFYTDYLRGRSTYMIHFQPYKIYNRDCQPFVYHAQFCLIIGAYTQIITYKLQYIKIKICETFLLWNIQHKNKLDKMRGFRRYFLNHRMYCSGILG